MPLLIDPGTSERDPELRNKLRGTPSHNTVVIDGENQFILARGNEVWNPAQAKLLFWGSVPEGDVMVGYHDG